MGVDGEDKIGECRIEDLRVGVGGTYGRLARNRIEAIEVEA